MKALNGITGGSCRPSTIGGGNKKQGFLLVIGIKTAVPKIKKYNQTQTAEVLGLTQVQVSRREKKILTALRAELSK